MVVTLTVVDQSSLVGTGPRYVSHFAHGVHAKSATLLGYMMVGTPAYTVLVSDFIHVRNSLVTDSGRLTSELILPAGAAGVFQAVNQTLILQGDHQDSFQLWAKDINGANVDNSVVTGNYIYLWIDWGEKQHY